MENKDIQVQIDQLNTKMDLILDHLHAQKQRAQVIDDLVSDVQIIGNDAYISLVNELDNQGIELDVDELKLLVFKLVKNIGNVNTMLGMFESTVDFMKDFSPIFHEVGIDAIKKMHELEKKGYFEFFRELMKVGDNIVSSFSNDDVKDLADNVVTILETVKNLTQPDMLSAINNAVNVFKNIETENIPEVSIWKAMRELRTPEMKRGLGFMITFLKNLSENNQIKTN